MRYSETHKEETHKRIVKTAAKAFRKHGINGIGLVPVMKETGLTHGGFYAHFKSKDALIAEAIDAAFQQTLSRLRQAAEAAPEKTRLRAVLDEYLTEIHRDDPSSGCAVAALGTETARLKPTVREHFDTNLEAMLDLMMGEGRERPPRADTIRALAAAVGALVLSRTVRSKELSREILAAARQVSNPGKTE
jgi:TetR/AcrR family transcriptional regulator, transcriptional repressor for nem operon